MSWGGKPHLKARAKLEPLKINGYGLWSLQLAGKHARRPCGSGRQWQSSVNGMAVREAGHQMTLGDGAGRVLEAQRNWRLETDTIRSVLKIAAQLSCGKWREEEARVGVGRVGSRPKRGAEEPGRAPGVVGMGGGPESSRCGRRKPDPLDHG